MASSRPAVAVASTQSEPAPGVQRGSQPPPLSPALASTKAPEPPAPVQPEDESPEFDLGGVGQGSGVVVDMEVFGQLLEIDDDESHDFSKTLAFDYISQADATFTEMQEALDARDLDCLSRKGHFLKGSSAALGLQRVQHSCESMQHFGNRKNENGEGPLLEEDEALRRCKVLLARLREEQQEGREWLEGFFA